MRVLVADDHAVVCAGLAQWLESQPDVQVVAQAHDGATALKLAIGLRPDIVVMDLQMPIIDGVEATRRLAAECPEVAVVVLTTYFEPATVTNAIDAGARGYFLKDVPPSVLIEGLRAVMRGELSLSPKVASILFEHRGGPYDSLTPREREILDLIAAGQGNKQIARHLGITEKTVKAHCTRLFQRIGVSDRTQAALWAVEHRPAPSPFG